MSIKALQEYTYYAKYARYDKNLKRRETWAEAVERVKAMHLRRYPEAAQEIEWAFEQVKQRRVLGSQRALQYGGEPIERKHARIYNCTVSFCDRMRFFQESLWLLLCGCGVGFSVQHHHVAKLPDFSDKIKVNYLLNGHAPHRTFQIPDSIEGWADALGVLLATYLPSAEYAEWEGIVVDFDYSLIRPAGAALSSGAGKAPGPEPLRKALDLIRSLLNRRLSEGHTRLRPIDAYDIVMHASDAVISGGVRRSATICIFSPDDIEMATAKTGNWFNENPQRGRSNNSAMLLRSETTREDFLGLMKSVKEYGEPAFYWSDSTEQLPNPCVEIGMWPVHSETGKSGWQFCNLCEINGKKVKSKADFETAAKAAAIIGTLQAGYTDFDYLGKITEEIVRREALLGVSMTGMMDNPDIIFDPKVQREMARVVVQTNEAMARKIGINAAARTTCVKPAGTTSCILGSSSGIHPHHARRYFRRVQANYMESTLLHFKQVNPSAVEKSVWNANGTDEVITFCVEVPDGARTKNDMSAVDLLKQVRSTFKNWVTAGKVVERCAQPWLSHNVSNTINVREDEWDDVADFIYTHRESFSGVSLLPQSGDLDYPQAPFCNILTAKEILHEYGDGALLASGLVVDGLHAFDDNLWEACDTALGRGKQNPEEMLGRLVLSIEQDSLDETGYHRMHQCLKQIDWIRRVEQFAHRYCGGDVVKCCRLMKHVNNWKSWLDLNRDYKDVDWTSLVEEEDTTPNPMAEPACAGGACELPPEWTRKTEAVEQKV
jgi:ribonucleoside-triphosphate reductase